MGSVRPRCACMHACMQTIVWWVGWVGLVPSSQTQTLAILTSSTTTITSIYSTLLYSSSSSAMHSPIYSYVFHIHSFVHLLIHLLIPLPSLLPPPSTLHTPDPTSHSSLSNPHFFTNFCIHFGTFFFPSPSPPSLSSFPFPLPRSTLTPGSSSFGAITGSLASSFRA